MASTAEGDRFTVEVRLLPGVAVLKLAGELDNDTAEPLAAALRGLLGTADRVLVDFSEVGFCDSTGLNVLLRARLSAERAETAIELVGLRGPVRRMFRITGADEVFPVYADVAEALAVPPQHPQ